MDTEPDTSQRLTKALQTIEGLIRENSQLKEDKVELLTQLKQAYASLDHKDEEMQHMMLDYKEHMVEVDETIRQLTNAKADAERMRWMLLSKAKVATDQVLGVQARLEHVSTLLADRDKQLAELHAHLHQLKEKRNHDSVDSGLKSLGLDLLSRNPSPASPDEAPVCSAPDSDVRPTGSVGDLAEAKRRRQWSARRLSQVFTRSRTRSAVYSSSTSLNSDRAADQAVSEVSMKTVMTQAVTEWRAGDVYTWVVRVLGMTQYGRAVADNVKSGAVLVQLRDSDMEKTLAMKDALHRRKLRLAIDELRLALDSGTVGYHSNLASLSHDWVAHSWLCDLGLGQYSMTFDLRLVDGRVLSSLTRSDLDKHLGIHQVCHINSILMGVQLLRMVNFDRQELERRRLAQPDDASLWTNAQCVNWLTSIDLMEYTEQARSVGLHGALLMLDSKDTSASADSLASLLHIAQSKALLRKHLAAEFDKLKGKVTGSVNITSSQPPGDSGTLTSQVTLRRPVAMVPGDNDSGDGGEGRLVKTASGRKKRNWRNSIGHLFARKTTDFADCGEQRTPPCDNAVPTT